MRNSRKATSRARIVNVSSPGGIIPLPTMSAYCASKAAVESYSKVLRWEVEPLFGVKIITVRPGSSRTPMMKDISERQECSDPARMTEYGESFFTAVRNWVALGYRVAGDPVRAADAVVHAASASSPQRSYLPGRDAIVWYALAMIPGLQWVCFSAFTRLLPTPACFRCPDG